MIDLVRPRDLNTSDDILFDSDTSFEECSRSPATLSESEYPCFSIAATSNTRRVAYSIIMVLGLLAFSLEARASLMRAIISS
jgi:hypothetical protein